jgi:hypothetical protein
MKSTSSWNEISPGEIWDFLFYETDHMIVEIQGGYYLYLKLDSPKYVPSKILILYQMFNSIY